MCATCGCGTDSVHYERPDVSQLHLANQRQPVHEHFPKQRTIVEVERDILEKNNRLAERLKGFFEARNMFVLNLVSAPGSGKTTLLEKTLQALNGTVACAVIEGDQQTTNDADRIKKTNTPVVQINTGKGCHLDAEMIYNSLKFLQPVNNSILFIENVGNLVCPAMFDLGENKRVIIISVTEGDDKPAKYPDMFQSADLCIINKTDLLPYVNFDMESCKAYARKVNPAIEFIELSATTGAGLADWLTWLRSPANYLTTIQDNNPNLAKRSSGNIENMVTDNMHAIL